MCLLFIWNLNLTGCSVLIFAKSGNLMREAVCRKKRKGKEQSIRELDWPGAMRQGFVGVGGE